MKSETKNQTSYKYNLPDRNAIHQARNSGLLPHYEINYSEISKRSVRKKENKPYHPKENERSQ